MEKKYNIILIILLTLFSCESYLEKNPDLGLSEDEVFSSFFSTRGYLDKVYNCINDFSFWKNQTANRAHVGQMSDEAANPYGFTQITNYINKGIWLNSAVSPETGWSTDDVGSNLGRVIPNAFLALRISNRIIEKVPTMSILSKSEKEELLGQAYFFRAWFYFEIIRRVGGMPIFDKVLSTSDNMDMERKTYWESHLWVIEQLDQAIELLPHEWLDSELGRPNKAAAYAVKEMAALYAASPLMCNPLDKIENNGYDVEKAKLAAQYAKECLEYVETNVPAHKMMPGGANYKYIFYHSPNFVSDESLWYINSAGAYRRQGAGGTPDIHIFWLTERTGGAGNYGQANVSISQNLIDKFQTINGYNAILTPTGWESNDPTFDPINPFDNRDPRFDAFILYPGEQYGNYANGSPNYVCTWEGGADVEPAVPPGSTVRTGYQVKKWLWPEAVKLDKPNHNDALLYYYNCVHIRTTQVWLDYAEAMNEAYGPTTVPAGYTYSSVDAINKVRARVGMPAVKIDLTTDATRFRNVIRDERAVELLLENHRWFDIRRWMIAESLFNMPSPIKGIRAIPSDATQLKPNPGNVFTYQLKDVPEELRVFERKHYWYPIPQEEANRYINFKQNPGW